MRSTAIETAGATERELCCEVLTRAFAADPPTRWVWPDPEQYREVFPHFVRAFGGAAFEAGTAFRAESAGVSLWLAPGTEGDAETLVRLVETTVPGPRHGEVFALFEQMDRFHPHEPVWYLPLIGVDPAYQGRGIGSALLRHALETCDEQGLPAYLEATTPGSVRLYQRHGFEPLGSLQVPGSPEIVPMLRKPVAD